MEYFQECIKNKTIPKDTPYYFKKALEHAMKEYEKGIKFEKSALFSFAEMCVIDGKPGVTPMHYFSETVYRLKDFLRNHRNIKLRAILVCLMEKKIVTKLDSGDTFTEYEQDKAYFHSKTLINLEKTDVKEIISKMFEEILIKILEYNYRGSDWYFREVLRLEIHIVDYKQ